jgi:hypothetical protein
VMEKARRSQARDCAVSVLANSNHPLSVARCGSPRLANRLLTKQGQPCSRATASSALQVDARRATVCAESSTENMVAHIGAGRSCSWGGSCRRSEANLTTAAVLMVPNNAQVLKGKEIEAQRICGEITCAIADSAQAPQSLLQFFHDAATVWLVPAHSISSPCRGAISRLAHGFSGLQMQYLLPPDGRVGMPSIYPTDHICRASQSAGDYIAGLPQLQANPGDYIALQYRENGHVILLKNTS